MEDENKNNIISMEIGNPRFDNNITIQMLNSMSINEARGWIIEEMNIFEREFDEIITKYFAPHDTANFKKILLHSSIIGFANKLNIVLNLNKDFEGVISKLKQLSNIRNAFAHARIRFLYKINLTTNENNIKDFIYIKKSSGEIEEKDPQEYLDIFWKLSQEIRKELSDLTKSPFL